MCRPIMTPSLLRDAFPTRLCATTPCVRSWSRLEEGIWGGSVVLAYFLDPPGPTMQWLSGWQAQSTCCRWISSSSTASTMPIKMARSMHRMIQHLFGTWQRPRGCSRLLFALWERLDQHLLTMAHAHASLEHSRSEASAQQYCESSENHSQALNMAPPWTNLQLPGQYHQSQSGMCRVGCRPRNRQIVAWHRVGSVWSAPVRNSLTDTLAWQPFTIMSSLNNVWQWSRHFQVSGHRVSLGVQISCLLFCTIVNPVSMMGTTAVRSDHCLDHQAD